MADIDKMRLGRFYTQTNPFMCDPFYQWILYVSGGVLNNITFIEPFAGANNIVELVNESLIVSEICDDESKLTWKCYDIDPASNEYNTSGYSIKKQDTLENMPKSTGEFVYITNPPYLAKNSATRSGIDVDFEDTDDLYKLSLKKMLIVVKTYALLFPTHF